MSQHRLVSQDRRSTSLSGCNPVDYRQNDNLRDKPQGIQPQIHCCLYL